MLPGLIHGAPVPTTAHSSLTWPRVWMVPDTVLFPGTSHSPPESQLQNSHHVKPTTSRYGVDQNFPNFWWYKSRGWGWECLSTMQPARPLPWKFLLKRPVWGLYLLNEWVGAMSVDCRLGEYLMDEGRDGPRSHTGLVCGHSSFWPLVWPWASVCPPLSLSFLRS